MAAGVDFLGDANVKLNKEDTNKNIIEKIFEWIGKFIDTIKPFKSALVIIRANYDRSIILFFEIL